MFHGEQGRAARGLGTGSVRLIIFGGINTFISWPASGEGGRAGLVFCFLSPEEEALVSVIFIENWNWQFCKNW